MRRPALTFCVLSLITAPAAAMVGGAYVVPNAASRPEVMLVGSHGNFCTGVAIARDLVLTAAHCVPAGAEFKQVELDAERKPVMKDVLGVARHPQFNLKTMLAHRATADVALVKLARPLNVTPVPLMGARARVTVGERFAVYGYGMSVPTDAEHLGDAARRDAHRDRPAGQSAASPGRSRDRRQEQRPRRLHRRQRRPGLSGRRRIFRRDGRGELVDRRKWERRLRRTHGRHAGRALSRLDRRHRGEDGFAD